MASCSRELLVYEQAQQSHDNGMGASFNGHMVENPGGATVVLHHNPGISMDWSGEEQALLEESLNTNHLKGNVVGFLMRSSSRMRTLIKGPKFAAHSNLIRYAKIAAMLPNKTVRDVALRVRWMMQKENSRKRKEENGVVKKSKDKKEKVIDPSANPPHLVVRPLSPYDQGMASNGILYSGQVTLFMNANGRLLQHNAQVLQHIALNQNSYQIHANIPLLCEARDNLIKVMNNMGEMPVTAKAMPPLDVKLDEELANHVLPPPLHVSNARNVNYDPLHVPNARNVNYDPLHVPNARNVNYDQLHVPSATNMNYECPPNM
ncbi:hypothetical protein LguiA_029187 [Lonicera macranthoides]